MNFHDFHFLRPWWLLAFPLGLVLLSGLHQQKRGQSQWYKVCDRHLLGHLLAGEAETGSKRIYGFLLLMLLLATLALAGPTWERRPQPLFRSATGRVLVLDLSLSMRSTDLSPNRLSRARYKAIDLIKAGVGIDQGLVVFAGDSFIVTPLTDDRATILNLLPGLDTNTVPVQGSRADRGLEKAGELLRRAAVSNGQIILIADDADEAAVMAATKLKKKGYRVDVIAVGSKVGAPVPLPEGGYLKDIQGNIVVPVPDFEALRQVAARGGGHYYDIEAQWLDRGPWLLVPLVLLAAFCFRRGWLLLILVALCCHPDPAFAFNWQDLWQRPDQQATTAFKQKDYQVAAQLAKDPEWQAAALYRDGKFKQAAAALKPLTAARDHYNRGNALARAGELKKALAAYDQALKLDPKMEDARFNRKLLEKLLKQQQQKQKKSDKSQKSDKNKQNSKKQQQEQHKQQSEQGKPKHQDSDKENHSSTQQEQKQQSSTSKQSQADKKQHDKKTDSESDRRPDRKAEQAKDKKMPTRALKDKKQDKKEKQKNAVVSSSEDEKPMDPKQQALEQWLRRVPDDPGGLLERKFFYQYRARQDRSQGHKGW